MPRLGIPDLRMNDGPQGFRASTPSTTQWPSGLTLAHSFDTTLFEKMGTAMGKEFHDKVPQSFPSAYSSNTPSPASPVRH